MEKEIDIFHSFLKDKKRKLTRQRDKILKVFLGTEKHLSAEELHGLIKKKYPFIGYTTVYRTMRLISDAGLACEVDFNDGIKRLEHKFGHEHHDHLVCLKCGRFFEVVDKNIERLQEKLARRYHFKPASHKMEIFGFCAKCRPTENG
ncbi:MAG: Fur family transcriptional regulator [Candidatus Omnitrophota bacterium]